MKHGIVIGALVGGRMFSSGAAGSGAATDRDQAGDVQEGRSDSPVGLRNSPTSVAERTRTRSRSRSFLPRSSGRTGDPGGVQLGTVHNV